ncbi:hypothetical protein GCM10009430_37740 [Aquimarina litoralis]|uniref:PH domain-containing protein n=1 Tax=Aquimarina litoralis TaxID=584605 RepID=A0ABP3UFI4_9FLAO
MNDHLIKNLWISLVKNIVANLVLLLIIFYTLKSNTDFLNSNNWIEWGAYLLIFGYWGIKENHILLEINKIDQGFVIISYSIFKGKKELFLNSNDILKVDSYDDLRIRYKSNIGKDSLTLKITAEPWNNLFGQIKSLKLVEQENKQKTK